jgi:hypothetical protein
MAFFVGVTTTNKIENYTTPGDVTIERPPGTASTDGESAASRSMTDGRRHLGSRTWGGAIPRPDCRTSVEP